MFKNELIKPFFDSEGQGGGGSENPDDSIANGETTETEGQSSEDLTGLKKNRDDLLAENKKLKTKNKKYEDAVDAEKVKQAEEAGDYQKANELKDERIKKQDALLKRKEIKLLAKENGFIDPEDILPHLGKFEFDEDLNVINSDEIIEGMQKNKPHLFKTDDDGNGVNGNIGTAGNPSRGSFNTRTFTRTEIGNPDFYEKHEAEIIEQIAQGRIK